MFRSETMSQAFGYITRMLTTLADFSASQPVLGKKNLIMCAIFMYCEWLQRDKQHALQFDSQGVFKYMAARYFVYIAILAIICLFAGQVQTFIYFQF